ncbi:MAG: response regulator [Desulfuromonadaceae bacterium]|nr:response regulator [Desulfuromonadaceae bacterium]
MPRKQTILLAEDDENVRNMTLLLLDNFGYEVISAVDGEDAVQKFRENKERITLLLFDVNMPKKNGIAAYEDISAIEAGIKVIFTSGYANATENVLLKTHGTNNVKWLPKPYVSTQLLKLVRKILAHEHS